MKMMSKIWFWDVLGSWDHWSIQLRLHTTDGAQSERIVLALQAETQRNQYARVLGQHVVDRWLADNRRSVNSRPVRQASDVAASSSAGPDFSTATGSAGSTGTQGPPQEPPEEREFCRALLRFSL